jgi:hypothetical protein
LDILNWLGILGSIEITYATNTLVRFSMGSRTNHLQIAFRIFGHSENIKIDHRPLDYSALSGIVPEFQTWNEPYLDAEKIPPREKLV